MDGDLRYAMIREHIATHHEIARLERSARPARGRHESRRADAAYFSGLAAVVGTMWRRMGRRALSA